MVNIISYRPLIILAVYYHIILANQLNSSFSCYLVCFLPKRFITAANVKTLPMLKNSKTGKLLLEAVKREEGEARKESKEQSTRIKAGKKKRAIRRRGRSSKNKNK